MFIYLASSSLVVIHGLQLLHEGAVVAAHRLSCSTAGGILVIQSGMEPKSPALQSRFLSTEPPGKSLKHGFTEALLYLLFPHGQEGLAGYSPEGRQELDTTEAA